MMVEAFVRQPPFNVYFYLFIFVFSQELNMVRSIHPAFGMLISHQILTSLGLNSL